MSWINTIRDALKRFRDVSKTDPLRVGLKGFDGSDWQDLQVQSATYKHLQVGIFESGKQAPVESANSDDIDPAIHRLYTATALHAFDGSKWNRWRNTYNFTAVARDVRTGSGTWYIVSPLFTIYNAKAIIVGWRIYSMTLGSNPQYYPFVELLGENLSSDQFRMVVRTETLTTHQTSIYMILGQGVVDSRSDIIYEGKVYAKNAPHSRIMKFCMLLSDITDVDAECNVIVVN